MIKVILIFFVGFILAAAAFFFWNYRKLGYHARGDHVFFVETEPGGLSFKEKQLIEADVKTFNILDQKYAFDANNVYFVSRIIKDADPKTFQVIKVDESRVEGVYSKDKNNVYKFSSPLKGIDPETFEIIFQGEKVVFKDKNQTYDSNGNPK